VALPITSFPLLSKLFGGTSVAPLSFLPMVLLILIVVLPDIFHRKALPRQFQPLYVYFLIAVFSIALAFLRELPSFRTIPVWRNALEGLVTLLFGFGFYLATIYCLKDQNQIRKALQWINLGGLIIILVVAAQFLSFKVTGSFPKILTSLQAIISASGRLYDGRATGLAFEPSWLAHQLNILYIPLWLGFTVRKETVYPKRLFGKIPFEALLLAGGIISMFVSFSRIGWITVIVVFMYLLFRLANSVINRFLEHREKETGKKQSRKAHFFAKLLLWLLLLFILLLLVFAAGLIMRQLDPRMERLFDISLLKQYGIMGWASRLSFAERITYWQAAFNVYLKHPWFGSGLGVAGYYYPEMIPSFGYQLPETLSVMLYDSFIPNAKNLWVRLLAETGIVGFSVFISWVVVHWNNTKAVEKRKQSGLFTAMGLAGQLLIIALIVEGFSLDTFGLPYYWIGFGLIVASWRAKSEYSASKTKRKSA
jgi:O-antigen ligase